MFITWRKIIKVQHNSSVKKRRPVLSGFLSLVSLGLGQIYNGELLKGVLLKVILLLSLCMYAILVFKSSSELLLLSALLVLFVLLKIYSTVQAFIKSRELGSSYILRKFNKSYFYVILTIIFLVLAIALPLAISRYALMEMPAYHPFRSAKAKRRYLEFYDAKAKAWPVNAETKVIDTSFGQTFVRISGPVDGQTLVLMHGANTTSLLWIPNIKALSESYRTYAVDNIYDSGRSVFTQKFKTPKDFVDWLDELFTSLELGDDINLMGLSYGGWLTSQYALHFPHRLNKIVLLAPAATVAPFGAGFIKHGIIGILPHRHFVKIAITWAVEDLAHKNEAGQKFVEDWVDHVFLALRCFKPKMLVSPTVLTDEELQNLKVPTLFLVGENEKIYSAQEALERLKRVAPHIKTEIIPDAGHDLTVVQAEMVNEIVLEFLKRPLE